MEDKKVTTRSEADTTDAIKGGRTYRDYGHKVPVDKMYVYCDDSRITFYLDRDAGIWRLQFNGIEKERFNRYRDGYITSYFFVSHYKVSDAALFKYVIYGRPFPYNSPSRKRAEERARTTIDTFMARAIEDLLLVMMVVTSMRLKVRSTGWSS